MTKNLLSKKTEYSRNYSDFHGVDFSSDPTLVHPSRFAYAVNMYKDYQSKQGQIVETITGYRKQVIMPDKDKINGIFKFDYTIEGVKNSKTIIHCGTKIYNWLNFPNDAGIEHFARLTVTRRTLGTEGVSGGVLQIDIPAELVNKINENNYFIFKMQGQIETYEPSEETLDANLETNKFYVHEDKINFKPYGIVAVGSEIDVCYQGKLTCIFQTANDAISTSFVFNQKLYILDGNKYLVYDGNTISEVKDNAYIPTTYINVIPSGENADIGAEYEQRNILQPKFKQNFIADGETKTFYLNENNVDSIDEVKVYGEVVNTTDYSFSKANGSVTLKKSPSASENYISLNMIPHCAFSLNNDGSSYSQSYFGGAEYIGINIGITEPTSKEDYTWVSLSLINDFGSEPLEIENYAPEVYFCPTEHFITIEDDSSYTIKADSLFPKNDGNITIMEKGSLVIDNDGYVGIILEDYNSNSSHFHNEGDESVYYYLCDITSIKINSIQSNWRYPENYAGIEITASKQIKNVGGISLINGLDFVNKCTKAIVFDNRVFITGNPLCPNLVFYTENNTLTGYSDASFFGIIDYFLTNSTTKSMMVIADSLAILKDDSKEGAIEYRTPFATGNHIQPKTYTATKGLSEIGCVGECINFIDDPIFISKYGVEAIGQLSVRLERAIEHRSSHIDSELTRLDLTKAKLCEWNGYLLILVDGKLFMADSRQKFTHENGNVQYEWYLVDKLGVWVDQYTEYYYSKLIDTNLSEQTVECCTNCHKPISSCNCDSGNTIEIHYELATSLYNSLVGEVENLTGSVANTPLTSGLSSEEIFYKDVSYNLNEELVTDRIYFTVKSDENGELHAYVCETKGAQTGGTYKEPTFLSNINEHLIFGAEDGVICMFNFDKRNEDGTFDNKWYTFDGRTILSGIATKADNCDIPHLTKNSVKRSLVIKSKTFEKSAFKLKVKTNKEDYKQIQRLNSSLFSFETIDFEDFSFSTSEQNIFSLKEKEKQWVEKQFYLYSDEYQRPFGIYYITFRYTIGGRIKS